MATSFLASLGDRAAASQELFGKEMSEIEGFVVFYPCDLVSQERLEEIQLLLQRTRAQLQEALSLEFPESVAAIVCGPRGYLAHRGRLGEAYRDMFFAELDPRRFSQFAGTVAHEMAHVQSRELGHPGAAVLQEGLACYAAELIDADAQPQGLPLHYHLVWMLGVGLRPSLADLWLRRDYTSEMYDVGWSLVTYLAETYGQRRFYQFYASDLETPDARAREFLGKGASAIEREWYEHARETVGIDHRQIGRLRREDGNACSRAGWLSAQ